MNNSFKCLGKKCPNHCCGSFEGVSNRLTSISGISYSDIILLPEDVENIKKIGRPDLIIDSREGIFKIKTYEDGTCYALNNGKCLIYEARPTICKAFPLYLDMFAGLSYVNDCHAFCKEFDREYYDDSLKSLLEIYQFWVDFYKQYRGDADLKIKCRQLKKGDGVNEEMLESIAELIYDTDPYIYPAMFGSKEYAKKLIPQLIKENDTMFQLDNLYIAEYNKRIVGLVLWIKGNLVWSKENFVHISNKLGIPVSKYLDLVTEKYVCSYECASSAETISVVNFCISKEFRGAGIGSQMMKSFLNKHEKESIELCVLEENPAAVRLYQNYGFCENSRYGGFSVDDRRLVCIGMGRKGK